MGKDRFGRDRADRVAAAVHPGAGAGWRRAGDGVDGRRDSDPPHRARDRGERRRRSAVRPGTDGVHRQRDRAAAPARTDSGRRPVFRGRVRRAVLNLAVAEPSVALPPKTLRDALIQLLDELESLLLNIRTDVYAGALDAAAAPVGHQLARCVARIEGLL